MDQVPLNALVGQVQVYDLTREDCLMESMLTGLDIQWSERILFKTNNSELWNETNAVASDYVALTEGTARFLVHRKVQTVGINYLSVDIPHRSDFPVHHILLENQIVIIEGLNLRHVYPGKYFLVCLSLKFSNAEAAPARAILPR